MLRGGELLHVERIRAAEQKDVAAKKVRRNGSHKRDYLPSEDRLPEIASDRVSSRGSCSR